MRTISRKLVCYKDTKQTLLEGLEQELSVYSSLSYDELCQEIGNPTQVSAQLMENISEQEIAYMKRRRKMILCTVSICFVIAFALAVFYFVHAQSVMRGDFYVQEHNTVESDTFVSSGTLDDTKRWSYEKEIFDYFSCCCNVIFIHCKCFCRQRNRPCND